MEIKEIHLEPQDKKSKCQLNVTINIRDIFSSNDLITKIDEILEKDINSWNWRVPLTIILYNLKNYKNNQKGRLEHIRLIGTEGEKGSFDQLIYLVILLQIFFKDFNLDIKIHSVSSFENFDKLTEVFDEIKEDIEKKYRYEDNEIAIDVTRGQKIVSIVGTFLH